MVSASIPKGKEGEKKKKKIPAKLLATIPAGVRVRKRE